MWALEPPVDTQRSSGLDHQAAPPVDIVTRTDRSGILAAFHEAGSEVRQNGLASAAGSPVALTVGTLDVGVDVGLVDCALGGLSVPAVGAGVGRPPPVQAPSASVMTMAPQRLLMGAMVT